MRSNGIGSEVGMVGRSYLGKPWMAERAATTAGVRVLTRISTWSFCGAGGHLDGRPTGTGRIRSG